MFQKISSLFSFKQKDSFTVFIEQITNKTPCNIELYKRAFKHKSLHKTDNYERLEFLGDSILDATISELLYVKFPNKNEGELSKIRSKIVSRSILNEIAIKLQLSQMYQFDKKLNFEKFENLGGNVLEALIGAVYLDYGFDEAKQFVLQKIIKPHINWDYIINTPDYKSLLLSKSQQQRFNIEFKVLQENPNNFKNRFKVALYVNGEKTTEASAGSIKKAEQKVSEMYLLK